MKILMLPAWFPNKLEIARLQAANYSLYTSFFAEQADALFRHAGIRVDILMPKIYALAKLPRLRSFPVLSVDIHKREGGEDWIGYYPYLLPRPRPQHWRHFGEELFRQYVEKNGMPDLLWSNGVLWSAFLANHLHHKYNIPYFIVERANLQILDGGLKKAIQIKGDIIRLFQEALFGAAACSQTARRMKSFLQDGVGDLRIVTNTIALPFERLDITRKNPPRDEFVLHNTARLDDNKNHAEIINAFAAFSREVPNAKLNIAGEGSNLQKIKAQIAQCNLQDKVTLLGYVSREGLAEHLLNSSAFICASHTETFNNTIIEALASGLPCISTPAGVAEDAINASNGIVTKSGSKEDLLMGMRHVQQNFHNYNSQSIRNAALEQFSGSALAAQLRNNGLTI